MPTTRRCLASIAALVVMSFAGIARAQPCSATLVPPQPEWGWAGSRTGVLQSFVWDSDGDGPLAPKLIARAATNAPAQFGQVNSPVAVWDGQRWSELPGLGQAASSVRHIGTYAGKLLLTGTFQSINGVAIDRVALFDGVTWSQLGSGLPQAAEFSLEHQGSLYLAGPFTTVGSVTSRAIIRWDGAEWRSLAGGVAGVQFPAVRAMVADGDQIIVGGNFATAGTTAASGVARYNPALDAWSAMGALPAPDEPRQLVVFNGEVYALAGFVGIRCVAFDGVTWQVLPDLQVSSIADYMQVVDGSLSISFRDGQFARFDGQSYIDLYADFGAVRAINSFQGQNIFAGTLSEFGTSYLSNIAAFDGYQFRALGNGFAHPTSTVKVRDLLFDGTYNYIAGDFKMMGGAVIEGIARRDAAGNYESLGSTSEIYRMLFWDPDGPGPIGQDLIVMTKPDGVASSGWSILRLRDGRWQTLAVNLVTPNFFEPAIELAVYNDRLFIAGQFTSIVTPAGSVAATGIASFDGTTWSQVGGGLRQSSSPASVVGMAVVNGELFIAGSLSTAGTTAVTNAVRWNGSTWSLANWSAPAVDLELSNGGVYMTTATQLLLWIPSSSTWITIAAVPANTKLAAVAGELYVGNTTLTEAGLTPAFPGITTQIVDITPTADGRLLIAGNPLAIWAPAGSAPLITSQPESRAVCSGESIDLTVGVEPRAQISYRWLRDGQPVIANRLITGTSTPTLRIARATLSDAGVYTLVITSGCGQAVSAGATVTVNTDCPPACDTIDFNGNGVFPEEQDVIDFFTVLSGGDCS